MCKNHSLVCQVRSHKTDCKSSSVFSLPHPILADVLILPQLSELAVLRPFPAAVPL